jgi:predicted dehydrogenase
MTVRIGLLAASRIAGPAVVEPAALVEGVEIAAVAARDLDRAREAAQRWDIPIALGSYDELIASDAVDAIYIATPASLHRHWAVAALAAGKHLLCEKPLAANAGDAQAIADAAAVASPLVAMEAFHWRYHPYVGQIREVLDSGVLGGLVRVEAAFNLSEAAIPRDDIRWELAIGGGSTMDLGCYPIQWVRFAVDAEPEVVSAVAECPVAGVDGMLRAELRWSSGVTGMIESSMIADPDQHATWLRIIGERGTMLAGNPLAPQGGGAVLTVDAESGQRTIEADRSTTYFHQLVAFRDAIEHGAEFPTTIADGVRNMAVIDACYRAAGLEPRPGA